MPVPWILWVLMYTHHPFWKDDDDDDDGFIMIYQPLKGDMKIAKGPFV